MIHLKNKFILIFWTISILSLNILLFDSCKYKRGNKNIFKNISISETEKYIFNQVDSNNYIAGAYFYWPINSKNTEDSIWISHSLMFFIEDSVKIIRVIYRKDAFNIINTQTLALKFDTSKFFAPIEKIEYKTKSDSFRQASPQWGDDSIYFVLLSGVSRRSTVFRSYHCQNNVSKPHPLCILYNLPQY